MPFNIQAFNQRHCVWICIHKIYSDTSHSFLSNSNRNYNVYIRSKRCVWFKHYHKFTLFPFSFSHSISSKARRKMLFFGALIRSQSLFSLSYIFIVCSHLSHFRRSFCLLFLPSLSPSFRQIVEAIRHCVHITNILHFRIVCFIMWVCVYGYGYTHSLTFIYYIIPGIGNTKWKRDDTMNVFADKTDKTKTRLSAISRAHARNTQQFKTFFSLFTIDLDIRTHWASEWGRQRGELKKISVSKHGENCKCVRAGRRTDGLRTRIYVNTSVSHMIGNLIWVLCHCLMSIWNCNILVAFGVLLALVRSTQCWPDAS